MAEVIPVKVYVRSRPFSIREKSENAQECLQFFVASNQISCNGKLFTFDNVLDPLTPQDTVYEITSSSLLEQFFKGFNCTILAYGQTGSGKTFTMGTEETTESMTNGTRGIIPRLVDTIFRHIGETDCPEAYKVSVSMLEIYDEKIHDLLSPVREPLQIREQGGVVFVQGLSKTDVSDLSATMFQLEKGCQLRSKGETAMNAKSSRSHAIFTICLEKLAVNEEDNSFMSKLHLVDLAGSERLKKTQAEGDRMREGIRINEGLLALGNVISALSEPAGNRHIPYRDSKITRLLQDSLGGNSYTVMIACVSPADTNAEETLSTLRYADRAKKIKNKPTMNIDPDQLMIKQLRDMVASLNRELAEYRAGMVPTSKTNNEVFSAEISNLKAELLERENHLIQAQAKTAETLVQKAGLCSQLIRLEEERDRLKSAIAETLGIIKDADSSDAAHLLRRVTEILDFKSDDIMEISQCTILRDTDGEADPDEDGEIDETYGMKFVDIQANLNRELEDVMKQIKAKEAILEQSTANQNSVDIILRKNKQEMSDLQHRIDTLLLEKTRLEAEIKKISTTNKLSEERRKKLQDLEKQLLQYKKQMSDMKRLEKQKAQSEESMKNMRNEITSLKQARVRMMKQSREESEKYRQWKNRMDRQLVQLKQKERKREFEVAKEKQNCHQQMVVYRQKYEEAKRCNKRLQIQMARSSTLNEEKNGDEKAADQAKLFVESELALIASSYEAEQMCQALKEQRRVLSMKITKSKKKRKAMDEEPPKKRRATDEGSICSVEDDSAKADLDNDIERLEKELDLCNTELSALQKGCTSLDVDSRTDYRWKDVHTVAYARATLKVLFDQAANDRKCLIDQELENKTLKVKIKELEVSTKLEKSKYADEIEKYKDKMRNLRRACDIQKAEFETKYANVISMLTNNQSIDSSVLLQLEEIHKNIVNMDAITEDIMSSKTLRQSRPKGLTRSHSSSCMEILSEEDRKTRASRSKIRSRFGDVKDTIREIDPGTEDEESVMDVSCNVKAKTTKKKPMRDISPIPDATMISDDIRYSIPPSSRRESMLLSKPAQADNQEKENFNATYVMDYETPVNSNRTIIISTDDAESKGEIIGVERATLVSGLKPHINPDLGPI